MPAVPSERPQQYNQLASGSTARVQMKLHAKVDMKLHVFNVKGLWGGIT